ncbi:DNA-binding NtrC family response regulator [Pseudorhizobium tarimense]|uniref:DNA-binding transcriptional regulator NtrC n=1 Tax=Pseudorhizobium tarimense TaxID=1079109 RepID=A0ABV2H7U3_9HYPH|nr:sigma-54 dependent transcriptional regulator [Pseudorhizobium tarimense]MCJ8519547.1 sigma-54 dependent transcriptional regulator [Pseudorhizobium tarimense]
MIAQILVIDEDPIQRRLLKGALETHEYVVHLAENGGAGLEFLRRHGNQIDVIVADVTTTPADGERLLAEIHEAGFSTPVIVQTSHAGSDAVVQAMRAGAFDFVNRPVSPERISASVANALKLGRKNGRGRTTRRSRGGAVALDDIVSASEDMLRVLDLSRRAAQSSIPVVLEGEPGVGKELVARAIHTASDRATKPFIAVNCGAVPAELLEPVLFGSDRQAGKFAEADGGTLFLDEIADFPSDVQVKLLRAVQDGVVQPVDSSNVVAVDVRVISATGRDLIEEVREGRFREDLYYRLNVFPITITALRRRREDIPHLARVFAERFSVEQKLPRPVKVGSAAMALLTAHDWPGNVRELENAMFRAVVLAQGEELVEHDFPQIAAQLPQFHGGGDWVASASLETALRQGQSAPDGRGSSPLSRLSPDAFRTMPPRPARPDPRALLAAAYPAASISENAIPTVDPTGEVRKLAEVEEELIRFALKFYRGQMSQVARKLGIGRSTLYRKLKDYGIDPDDPVKEAA